MSIRTWVYISACLILNSHKDVNVLFLFCTHTPHIQLQRRILWLIFICKTSGSLQIKSWCPCPTTEAVFANISIWLSWYVQNCIRCDRLTFHSTQFYSDVIDMTIHHWKLHIPSTQQHNNGAHGTKCFLEVIYYSCRTMKYLPSDYNITSSVDKPT